MIRPNLRLGLARTHVLAGNGHSHVRAAFLKPDLTIPVRDAKPLLGTWQQIVFVELDNKPRDRRIAVHVWGE